MHRLIGTAALAFTLAACGPQQPVAPATSASATAAQGAATTRTTVGGVTLEASTVAIADLNETIARRYGLDRARGGLLLLVTVRDAAGNGIDAGDLRLEASAGALPDAPAPLALRAIHTDGMTDYIGVIAAPAPSTVRYRIVAVRNGARADIAGTAELHPR